MKNKIAVDVDDVLFDFNRALFEFHNFKFKTSLKKKDFFTYELEKVFEVTNEEKTKRMNSFYESPYFFEMPLIEGAQESMYALSRNNEIIIITSRPAFLREQTEKSLDLHFNKTYSEIFYSGGYYKPGGKSKAEICTNQKVSFLIDDCLKFVEDCNSKKIPSFLIDKPWNKSRLKGTLITRVKNWKEILEKVQEKDLVCKLN